jgi:hypothetical protein
VQAPGTYDRVVSIEMFEHMKNYAELMRRVSTWLRPGGALFVHIFCHKTTPYHFEVRAGGGGQRRVRVCVFGAAGGGGSSLKCSTAGMLRALTMAVHVVTCRLH